MVAVAVLFVYFSEDSSFTTMLNTLRLMTNLPEFWFQKPMDCAKPYFD
jgi:hypothetical protein